MDWSDTYDIVDSLCEKYPNEEPEKLLFLDLMNKVTSLAVSYTHLTLPTSDLV